MRRPLTAAILFLVAPPLFAQTAPASKKSTTQSATKQLSPSDELQESIESAGNDRASLVRNLEAFLQKYPQAPERPQIFRALVEACLQLRDNARAASYAERLVSIAPDDMSITLLAIQLLEKNGDDAALKRAVNYSSRVIEYVHNSSTDEKSPRVSPEEWATEKKRDESSLLLLRSAHTAYFQSAGTSPQGMHIGASHFLVYEVCRELFRQGVRTFNLGGATEGSSLAGFKAGFGAAEVILYECACYVGPVWRQRVRRAFQLARTDRAGFWKLLSGNSYQIQVYALRTDAPMRPIPVPNGARFQPLSSYDLLALAPDAHEPQFRERQLNRLQRFGTSHAYGVYIGDKLAHVSWLLPPAAAALERPKILPLNDGEAEITGCETLPEFRGRNLYAFAIQQIFRTARSSGIHRIFMKTRKDHSSSQSGILKAGLLPSGIVTVFTPPAIPSKSFVLRRLRTVS